MPSRVELAQQPVVGRHLSFTLEDADGDSRLVVGGRAKDVLLFGRNRGVAFDQCRHHATFGFNSQASAASHPATGRRFGRQPTRCLGSRHQRQPLRQD